MLRKFYRITAERLDNIYWTLLLSCVVKEQMFQCKWQIYLRIKGIDCLEVYLWTVNLLPSKQIKYELDYIIHLVGELKEKIDYKCKKYQNWKSILEFKGSSFLEEGERCIAIGSKALDKLKPAQRFFTAPADLFDTVFTHKIDFFRRLGNESDYSSVEKNIIPLVVGMNSLHSTSTISSCQGHFLWPSNRYPFVCFISNIETVNKICRIIESTNLNLKWTLAGIVENGCPSLGPYITWKLMTRDKLNMLNNNKCKQDIAHLYSTLIAMAKQSLPSFPLYRIELANIP